MRRFALGQNERPRRSKRRIYARDGDDGLWRRVRKRGLAAEGEVERGEREQRMYYSESEIIAGS